MAMGQVIFSHKIMKKYDISSALDLLDGSHPPQNFYIAQYVQPLFPL